MHRQPEMPTDSCDPIVLRLLLMWMQDFTFESADVVAIERMLSCVALPSRYIYRRFTLERNRQYPSHAAAYSSHFVGNTPYAVGYVPPDAHEQAPRNYLPLCRLTERPSPTKYEEEIPVRDGAEAVMRAMTIIRSANVDAFLAETGEGPFAGSEGSVAIGYRLQQGSLETDLTISLCHIYFPK